MRLRILLLIILINILSFADQTTLIYPPFKHSMGYNRANSTIAKMVLGRNVTFHRTMGICALKLNVLDDKTTNKDDAILSLFGINNHQIVYNVGLSKLKTFGKKGLKDSINEFYYPTDISVDKYGDIYITDTYKYRVLKFKYDNDSLIFIKEKGSFGSDSNEFNLTSMIDYDSDKNIYVSDTRNNRIIIMDSLLNTIGILKNIEKPYGIVVLDKGKGYCRIKRDKFIIVSSNRNKLLKLTIHGDTIAEQFAHNIVKYSNVDFNFIDYDYNANIWITDTINSCIHKFDKNLKYITSFGKEGYGKKQFYKPEGITIYRKYGQVFITDRTGFQYFWIGVDGWVDALTPSVIDDSTSALTISLYTTEQCKVKIEIIKDNKIITKLLRSFRRDIGLNYIIWDLKDKNNNIITEKGIYTLKFTLMPLYSSRGYFEKTFEVNIEKI